MLKVLIGFLEFVMLAGVVGGLIDLATIEKKAHHAYMFDQVKLGDINKALGMKK